MDAPGWGREKVAGRSSRFPCAFKYLYLFLGGGNDLKEFEILLQ